MGHIDVYIRFLNVLPVRVYCNYGLDETCTCKAIKCNTVLQIWMYYKYGFITNMDV